ncbi:Kelch-like protein 12 [Myotis davidii]|uniref:Kelch-like protein 12 n=1 Tax=Myotis davidii TaxID=225400 RepID=L5MB69_MYODS|nr:Kelch-like protein 12 [Myotis davidii]
MQSDYSLSVIEKVDSEEPVFEAVINWVKHAKKEREESLPDLLQYVRMPLLTPRYITDVIDAEPFIRCSLQCRDLVDEAKKFHLRPELRSQMQGPRTRARLDEQCGQTSALGEDLSLYRRARWRRKE